MHPGPSLPGQVTRGQLYNLFQFYADFIVRSNLTLTQMADYIGFLREARFVEQVGSDTDLRIRITPYGLDFLSYIKGQYPAYKLKVW